MNALQMFEIEDSALEKSETKNKYEVKNIDDVNGTFRKIKAFMDKKFELEELAQKEIERVQNWLENEVKQINERIEFYNGRLTEYAVIQREQDPKFKCSTPYGKVSFRKQQPKWEYDDDTVIESLKASGLNEYIRVKEEVNKADLKKAVSVVEGRAITPDGEIIEGIKVTEQPDKLDIKVAE